MRKMLLAVVVVVLLSMIFAGYAHAGIWEKAKSWLTGEVLALVASTLLAILGSSFRLVFIKISRTFREAGEFMTILGMAIEDRRITRDELANIIKEGRDIFNVWG